MPSRAAPFSFVLASVILATAASADVGLWPTTTRSAPAVAPPDAEERARLERGVVDVAVLVLKERLKRLGDNDVADAGAGTAADDTTRCLADAGCRARMAAKLGVDELAHVVMTVTGQASPWATARLLVWRADGAVAFDDTVPVATDRDLRGVFTRAFDPARATARLDVTGLAADDTLLVDGLRSDARALLAPGAHTVVVLHQDGSRTTLPLHLGFEERRVVAVEPRLAPGGAAPSPGLVPAVVGGGVVVVGLAGAGVGAVAAATLVDPRQRDVAVVATLAASTVALLGGVTLMGALWPAPVSTTEVQP